MSKTQPAATGFQAPYPGSKAMPQWETGELPDAPAFRLRYLAAFLGPGVVMAAAAIGGGEWLTGPTNTARYGAAMFWLATLSILGQVVYNIEISRYTLYTGEPIFTGKFRVPPGPMFWLFVYLLLDFGSILPYLASNAAIPLEAMILGEIPQLKSATAVTTLLGITMTHKQLQLGLALLIFVGVFIPLSVGGKVYNSMKALMTFKLFAVFGFLLILAAGFSTWSTWREIGIGFVQFGNLPIVEVVETDTNGNGQIDSERVVNMKQVAGLTVAEFVDTDSNDDKKIDEGERRLDRKVDNALTAWWTGRPFGALDLSLLGFLAAMVAISGNGGLTNTPTSNYTRDQGWGMGAHVGAIPSIVGGHEITLSHVGQVFEVNAESLPRWKRWLKHIKREQYGMWMPSCFLGLALPSLLSMVFLTRGTDIGDKALASCITADGVRDKVGQTWGADMGNTFWYMTLLCGLLVLGTSMASTADGVLRRWVDVFWTASPRLRKWDTKDIGKLYFGVLCVYVLLGAAMLLFTTADALLVLSTMMYNYALGFSCLHTIVVNRMLMPKQLRPGLGSCVVLLLAGIFFLSVAGITTYVELPNFYKKLGLG